MPLTGTSKITERAVVATLLYDLSQGLGTMWHDPFTRIVQSNQPDGETHAWLGGISGMTERKGDPQFDKIAALTFFVRNVPFHMGIKVTREDWLYQKSGQIASRVNQMVPKALQHPGTLILSALANAESAPCVDGKYYFAADHVEGSSGTQSNALTVTKAGTLPTVDELSKAINTGIAGLWALKDDKGEYCNLDARDFTVGAPVTLMPLLLQTLGITIRPGSSATVIDPNNGAYRLTPQILPGVTGNKIVLMVNRPGGMGSAFVQQILEAPQPYSLGLESEYCKLNNALLFGIKGTYNIAYGRWQDAMQVTFTGP